MSGRKSEVVYRRPKAGYEEFDPENWDDSAIAKAYDTAVEKADKLPKNPENSTHNTKMDKSVLHKSISEQKTTFCQRNDKQTSHEVSEKPKKTNTNGQEIAKSNCNWKLGDTCMAMYYEDGLYYQCKIKTLNKKLGTCIVEYQGYGNQETLNISDLHQVEEWENHGESVNLLEDSSTSTGNSSSSLTCTSTQSTDDTSSDVTQDIYRHHGVKKSSHKQKIKKRNSNNVLFPPVPPHLGFNPYLMMPPMPPPLLAETPLSFHMGNSASPQVPDLPDISDDALSSMLMSWYMAGYHTGYYQGLNENKQRKSSSKMKNKH